MALSMTTSARCPSTSASTQIEETSRVCPGVTLTPATAPIASARAQGRLDIDGADDPIFGGVDGKLNDSHAPGVHRQDSVLSQAQPAVRAQVVDVGRVAAVVTALDHLVLGEQASEGPNRGGLAGALLAADEHTADRRHDGVQDQGQLHRVLADDR